MRLSQLSGRILDLLFHPFSRGFMGVVPCELFYDYVMSEDLLCDIALFLY